MDSGTVSIMDSGAVSIMYSAAVSHADHADQKVSRSYTPLSFYMDSADNHPGPIRNSECKNRIALSFFNETLVYYPAQSLMCIFVPKKEKVSHELSFYMDPTLSHPARKIYYPFQSKSSSQSNFIFGSFGTQSSSESKVGKNYIPLSTAAPSSKSMINTNPIPGTLTSSILSKLPVKSLNRFRCVCKSWSILLENPNFMTMYTNHFISRHRDSHGDDYHTFILTNHCLGYRHYHSEFYLLHNRLKLNLPSPLQRPGYCTCILGSTSVNGIFCLGQHCLGLKESQYVLWNPLTSEFMVIPSSPAELTPEHPSGTTVYLDHVFHGFGYDQFRHDFKVIQYVSFVSQLSPFTTSFLEIYSLKNNSWRMIDMDNGLSHWAYTHCMSFSGREVYLDGACHWLVYECINHRHAMTLLSFDLTLEAFLTTPIGEEPYNPYPGGRLTVLNGSIALISNYHDDLVFQISILGELGVSESWIKLYTYGPLPSIQWPPIGFGKMGPIFFKKKDYEVVYVDLSTQITEEVGITGGRTNYNIGGLYKESLLSLKDHVTRSLQGKPSFVGG